MNLKQTDLLDLLSSQPDSDGDPMSDECDLFSHDIPPYKQFHLMNIPLRGLNYSHALVLPKDLIGDAEVLVRVALSHLQEGEMFSAQTQTWTAKTVKNKSMVLINKDGDVYNVGRNPGFEHQFDAFDQLVRNLVGAVVLDYWDLLSPLKPLFTTGNRPPSLLEYAKRDPAWEYHCLVKEAVDNGQCVSNEIQDIAGLFVTNPVLF